MAIDAAPIVRCPVCVGWPGCESKIHRRHQLNRINELAELLRESRRFGATSDTRNTADLLAIGTFKGQMTPRYSAPQKTRHLSVMSLGSLLPIALARG